MAELKTCRECGKAFSGRKNKLFCSLLCKSKANNKRELALRKTTRRDFATMERNARIINAYMKTVQMERISVLKNALVDLGFDILGPFKLYYDQTGHVFYELGDYLLKDLSLSYIITKKELETEI